MARLPAWATMVGGTLASPAVKPEEDRGIAPLPWRPLLAAWPVAWRERWGHRANALESQGLGWRAAEEQAFAELLQAKREVEQSPPSRRIPSPKRSLFFKESA